MMLSNSVSRYHVAEFATRYGATVNEKVAVTAFKQASGFLHMAAKAKEYAKEHGQGALHCHSSYFASIAHCCVPSFLDPADTFDTPVFN